MSSGLRWGAYPVTRTEPRDIVPDDVVDAIITVASQLDVEELQAGLAIEQMVVSTLLYKK